MKEQKYIIENCEFCKGTGQHRIFNGRWFRQERKSRKVSLRKVAIDLGISAAYLSDVELGRRKGNIHIFNYFK